MLVLRIAPLSEQSLETLPPSLEACHRLPEPSLDPTAARALPQPVAHTGGILRVLCCLSTMPPPQGVGTLEWLKVPQSLGPFCLISHLCSQCLGLTFKFVDSSSDSQGEA